MADTTTLYIRNFPADLHKKLKQEALAQDKTLQDLVTDVLAAYISLLDKSKA